MTDLFAVKIRSVANYLISESLPYKLIFLYLFFEYVRPQTLYPALDFLPYAQLILISCFVVQIGQERPFSVKSPINALLWAYLCAIVLSSVFGISFQNSFDRWAEFLTWFLIYYLIVNIVDTKERFFLYFLFFLLYSFKMGQFSFRGWVRGGMGYSSYGFGGGPGWFQNSGEFGIQMCVYFPMAFYFWFALKKYWPRWKKWALALLPLVGLTGMLSSSNRGTLVGGGAVVLWMVFKSNRKAKAFLVMLFAFLITYQFIPEDQLERFRQAGDDATSVARTENWKKGLEMAKMFPVFGVGFKNWQIADYKYFSGNGLLAHNVFVECLAELGYLGLFVFILLICFTLITNYKTRQICNKFNNDNKGFFSLVAHSLDAAMIGFLVSGFFVTVLYYPYFWINLAFTVALHNVCKNIQASENEKHKKKLKAVCD